MNSIGIFFGTDTGTTRLVAKKLARKLDGLADKPVNINRISIADMLKYDVLILGTPTYGEGQLPGNDKRFKDGSWLEFVPQLMQADLSGKVVALYGLGDQVKYGERFADGLYALYDIIRSRGASIIGSWSTEGYDYQQSKAEVEGRFVGLVIDNLNQPLETEPRIDAWLELIKPQLLPQLQVKSA